MRKETPKMTTNNKKLTRTQKFAQWVKLEQKITTIKKLAKWLYDYPYGYVRLLVLAGAAGMYIYQFTKAHVTISGVDAIAGVVAVIVVAHLLGGLKAIKR